VRAAVVLEPQFRIRENRRDISNFLRDRLEPIKWPADFVFRRAHPQGTLGPRFVATRWPSYSRRRVETRAAGRVHNGRRHWRRRRSKGPPPSRPCGNGCAKGRVRTDERFLSAGGDSLGGDAAVLTANEVFDANCGSNSCFGEASTIRRWPPGSTNCGAAERRSPEPACPDDRRTPSRCRQGTPHRQIGASKSALPELEKRRRTMVDMRAVRLEKTTGLRRLRQGPGLLCGSQLARLSEPRGSLCRTRRTIRFVFPRRSFDVRLVARGKETDLAVSPLETLLRAHGGSYDLRQRCNAGNVVVHLTDPFPRIDFSRFCAGQPSRFTPGARANRAIGRAEG